MRITIIQSEIEEAIRDKIRSQIQIQEGMEIGIVLRATRGVEGYQADIDIRPEGSAPATPAVSEPIVEKPLKIEETIEEAKTTKPAARRKAPAKSEDTPPATQEASNDTTDEPQTEAEQEPATGSADEPEVASEAEPETASKVSSIFASKKTETEEAPAAPKTSIFGDMKRPVNA